MKTLAALALFSMLAPPALAHTITGDYLEARTADVYTGPCVANGEVGTTGRDAVLAWRVRTGTWEGVSLDGLAVVAVVHASATLGDPHADPLPARAILLVDDKASGPQRRALLSLARHFGGALVGADATVEPAPIVAAFDAPGVAALRAGNVVEVRTRALAHCDLHCGNEEVYYAPLAPVADAVPAVTLIQAFRGTGLGTTWSSSGKRSAFVATFSR